jgi:hypothetical protein
MYTSFSEYVVKRKWTDDDDDDDDDALAWQHDGHACS